MLMTFPVKEDCLCLFLFSYLGLTQRKTVVWPSFTSPDMKDGDRLVALVKKINAFVQIGRLSGLSVIYHLISSNKLMDELPVGVVPLNLLVQSGFKTHHSECSSRGRMEPSHRHCAWR